MARKSRKGVVLVSEQNVSNSKELKECWETAAYVRLSVENGGNETDDTVQTQLAILEEYIRERSDLKLVDIYIDNGYSGVNFRRPDFERMMEDIKKKKIRCIVVKDLSRFGRNYLETGYYIETILPFFGVRLIAINDNFDSSRKEDMESLEVPIRNMVNGLYSKDISKKVFSATHEKMRRAVPMSSVAPYGYIYNREKEKYEIDEETADYVKLIFHWALKGVQALEIAERLELAGVPTKRQRAIELGVIKTEKMESSWNRNAVVRILRHPVYTGAIVSGRQESALFAGRKKQDVPPEDWNITEGMHEPIVSKDDFEMVKKKIGSRHRKKKRAGTLADEHPDDMKGLVFCSDCGSQMLFIRKEMGSGEIWNYYRCGAKNGMKPCRGHNIPELLLKTLVMDEISRFINLACDKEKVLEDLHRMPAGSNPVYNAAKRVNEANAAVKEIRNKRERLYEDYANGILVTEDYIYMNDIYLEQFAEAERNMEDAVKEKRELEQMLDNFHKQAGELAVLRKEQGFNRKFVENMVERIEVGRDKNIRITFKFSDIFSEILKEEIAEK